ncbi:hypothetical protein QJS04_geneDACA013862 [Acorus gramineus]|uniref:Aminotransferase class V domain-containing protein n=1 Tax=Acorus gramineus TaxID=55184 RepID=A0AAV9AXZ8_ACOGR|nr:hypothetical protein QJS04_geneDACA013862 [Acorus gramineus]
MPGFGPEKMGSSDVEDRCEWLRSQLIGADAEFTTPFGKRALTYADHTASGRGLHCIETYITETVLPFYGNTHTTDSYVGHRTTKMVHQATEYVKRCMGGGPDDALLFCGAGTTAAIKRLQEVMGIAVPPTLRDRVLGMLKREERWVVFLGPYEHHSNLLSWRQSLAEVVEIGANDEGLIDVDALRAELGSGKYENRPVLGSFSACSNVTGIHTDVHSLARLLHQHGAFACFDYAASGPYVEIDMRSGDIDGYDAVFLSPHKFVGGPGTPGVLLMSKALYRLSSSLPSTCGGGTVRFVNGFNDKDTLYYDEIEEREDAGTPPIVQKIRASLAFWVKEYVGYELIESREQAYLDIAFDRLLKNPNVRVLGNTAVKRQPIISFLILPGEGDADRQPLHGRFVTKLLNDVFGIQARGGCSCAGPYGHLLLGVDDQLSLKFRSAIEKGYEGLKPGWTRVSFSYYLSREEVEFILDAIEFVAAFGHRFLQLYHFSLRTGNWSFKNGAFNKGSLQEYRTSHGGGGGGTDDMFRFYLEDARRIAEALPDYPLRLRFPKDVDSDVVLFEV